MVGEYLLELRSEAVQALIENGDFKKSSIARNQGYVQGLDSYLELETELDRYKIQTEAEKKRNEQMLNSTQSITSQAEAMGII